MDILTEVRQTVNIKCMIYSFRLMVRAMSGLEKLEKAKKHPPLEPPEMNSLSNNLKLLLHF